MAEPKEINFSNKECLETLYYIRQNAQKVLIEHDTEADKKLVDRFCDLANMVYINEVLDERIKAVFDEFMGSFRKKVIGKDTKPEVQSLLEIKIPDGLFTDEKKLKKFKDKQTKLRIIKNKLQNNTESLAKSQNSVVEEEKEEEPIVTEIRAEVRAYCEKNYQGSELERRLTMLDSAKRITLESVKDKVNKVTSKIAVKIDKEKIAEFELKCMGRSLGVGKYSSCGCISSASHDVLKGIVTTGEDAYYGIKKSKSMTLTTAKGKTRDKQRNKGYQQENNKKNVENLMASIPNLENDLVKTWNSLLPTMDSVSGYKDLMEEDGGVLRTVYGLPLEKIKKLVHEGILNNDALWSLYQKSGEYMQVSKFEEFRDAVFDKSAKDKIRLAIDIYFGKYSSANTLEEKKQTVESCFGWVRAQMATVGPKEIANDVLLDEVYSFTTKVNDGKCLTPEKVQFLNMFLDKANMRINLRRHKITKIEGAKEKLNKEIHGYSSKIKKYKCKMIAVLYHMGKELSVNGDEAGLLYCGGEKIFGGICDIFNLKDQRTRWTAFVNNPENRKKAKQTFEILNEEYDKNVDDAIATMQGEQSVVGSSLHHVVYAYSAPLWADMEGDIVKNFNSINNTVETLRGHPALEDAHVEKEHRFQAINNATLFVERDGVIMPYAVGSCQKGDVLVMPVLCVRDNEHDKYRPLMQQGSLFVTSSGKSVQEPTVIGIDRGKEFKFDITPTIGGNDGYSL